MNNDIYFEGRNRLTEYQFNYRLINTPLWYCYIALGGKLSQLSSYLFCRILDSRLYGEKAKTKINEEKRIYTDVGITMESILKDINSVKYANNEETISSDQTNLIRRIKDLDDQNIFYNWKCRDYFVFVMERDVGCWKYYNPKGYVSPKTLKKIIALSGGMIKHMIDLTIKNNVHITEDEIRLSYGKFLKKMVGKLNPLVVHSIPQWNEESLGDYIKKLREELNKMRDSCGVEQDDKFFDNIPLTVSKKLRKYTDQAIEKHAKSSEDTMVKPSEKSKVESLESELVPKNQNVAKQRREKRPRKIKDVVLPVNASQSSEPKLYRFDGEVNPFKDTKEFMRYYRAFLTMRFYKSVKFDMFRNDANYASEILDMLVSSNRNDKVFLNGWLSHFCEHKLKGTKAYKVKYTSMKALKDTFSEFNPIFPYAEV